MIAVDLERNHIAVYVADMAEEVDSLEISQLKAMVLAYNNEVSVLNDSCYRQGLRRGYAQC